MSSVNGVYRFAPSPSGQPHAGNIRTALFSYLLAKHNGGSFILRLEDTNSEKSTPESIKAIFDTLEWLGLKSDEEVIYQSKRSEIYKSYIQILLDKGFAYKCYCSKEELEAKREDQLAAKQKPLYDRKCLNTPDQPGKPYVVRLRIPDHGGVVIKDTVMGRISVRFSEMTDTILQREDGSIVFILANVLDDCLQNISQVVRGCDGLSHSSYQQYLCEILGFRVPTYTHLPFVMNGSGQKLSKRNGDDSILDLKEKGYLPEAVINTLARLGWSHHNQEVFSQEELIEYFDGTHINKSPASFDIDKLNHLNGEWMKRADTERLSQLLLPFLDKKRINIKNGPDIKKVVKTLQNRAKTLVEMAGMSSFYYEADFELQPFPEDDKKILKTVKEDLQTCDFKDTDDIGAAVATACLSLNKKLRDIGATLRLALTGSTSSPGLYELLEVLGKTESINRLERAISL